MFIVDAGYVLEEGTPDYKPHQWMPENEVKKAMRGSLPGAQVIGDHGPEFQLEKTRPVEAEAILGCGHRLQFTVAPVTGELLYCSRCESWEICLVPGGFLFRCLTCNTEPEVHYGHNNVLVMARARKHRVGKDNRYAANPHVVQIGRYTETEVVWKNYEKGMEL